MTLIFRERVGQGMPHQSVLVADPLRVRAQGAEARGYAHTVRRGGSHSRPQRPAYVPIIEHDSWSIACHLEDRFPDRPSLFGGDAGRGAARLVNIWSDSVLGRAMRRQIYGDFVWVIDPADRAYFRNSREALLGATLEDYSAERDEDLAAFSESCAPLERALLERPYLAGTAPAYVDYVVFSVFQWARVGSPRDVLANTDSMDAVRAWRARMVALYDNLGDRFPRYPSLRIGPDGRAASEE